jgi:O-antigen ligase
MKVALDNPFFGCGGWGYRHFSLDKMSDSSFRRRQTVGGANVHNDYLQFIVEHGVVGFLLLFTVFAMFLWPVLRIWKAIIVSVRFMKPKDKPPRPVAIFALPASAFCVLLTVLATLAHAFGDCPLRSPAILSLFFVSMACVDGFLPRLRQQQN